MIGWSHKTRAAQYLTCAHQNQTTSELILEPSHSMSHQLRTAENKKKKLVLVDYYHTNAHIHIPTTIQRGGWCITEQSKNGTDYGQTLL